MYNRLIKEFARRTKENLVELERLQARGGTVYETTQLINSALGLIVLPRELQLFEVIGEMNYTFNELPRHGWPEIKPTVWRMKNKNLEELTRCLRNSVAHFNWKVESYGLEEIDEITLWDEEKGEGGRVERNFEITLTIRQLRVIAERYVDIIDRFDENETTEFDKPSPPRQKVDWDEKSFFNQLSKTRTERECAVVRDIYGWAQKNPKLRIKFKRDRLGGFYLTLDNNGRVFTLAAITLDGAGEVQVRFDVLAHTTPYANPEERLRLLRRMTSQPSDNIDEVSRAVYLGFARLAETGSAGLIGALEEAVSTISANTSSEPA